MMRHERRPNTERGDSTVGVVVAIPAFLLFLGLVIMGGRVAVAQQAALTAANEGARTASIARDVGQGAIAAERAARDVLANGRVECLDVQVTVDTARARPALGTPGEVSVTVRCEIPLAGLGLPGDPRRTVTSTGTSVIDAYRAR